MLFYHIIIYENSAINSKFILIFELICIFIYFMTELQISFKKMVFINYFLKKHQYYYIIQHNLTDIFLELSIHSFATVFVIYSTDVLRIILSRRATAY